MTTSDKQYFRIVICLFSVTVAYTVTAVLISGLKILSLDAVFAAASVFASLITTASLIHDVGDIYAKKVCDRLQEEERK